MRHIHSSSALLAAVLAASSGTALGGQTLTGDYIEATYSDDGVWNWDSTTSGLRVRSSSSGSFIDVTYPGTPWNHIHVEYDLSGTSYDYYVNSDSGTSITVSDEDNLSTSSDFISYYVYEAGDLLITKVERWSAASKVMYVGFEVANLGSNDVSNLRLVHAIDPDTDQNIYSDYNTLNDVLDLDSDGTSDWVESVGPSSGWTVGYGACEPSLSDLGHNASWDRDADIMNEMKQWQSEQGLFRDAECLVWALARDPVRLNGRTPAELSVFYTANYAMLDMAIGQGLRCMEDTRRGRFCATADGLGPGESPIMQDYMVAAGTDVREWLQAVDVVVVFESVLRAFFAVADKLGVQRKVLVLKID